MKLEEQKRNKLNIIWVFADQMRGQAMSCSGDENVYTPNLDLLAKEGVRFEAACSTYPVCVPFRFTLLTGERASSRWVPTIHWRMSPAEKTIAHHLNENGYQTSYIGKWHLFGGNYTLDQYKYINIPNKYRGGFKRWKGFELRNNHFDTWYYSDNNPNPKKIEGFQCDGLFGVACNEIEEMSICKEPFFLVLSIEAPHPPYNGPNYNMKNRDKRDVKFRENVDPKAMREYKPWLYEIDGYSKLDKENDGNPEKVLKSFLVEYYESIENIDKNMGKIIAKLKECGVFENTAIMFFSDHGELLGSHGLQDKQWPYEESINIPFIVKIPDKHNKQNNNRIIETPICTEDIFPTTLGIAGVDIPEAKPGKNLLEWIIEKKTPDREGVFLEFVEEQRDLDPDWPWRGYRTKNYKYIIKSSGPFMLFDLESDPYEQNNLINDNNYSQIKDQMHAKLMSHIKENDESFYYTYAEQNIK